MLIAVATTMLACATTPIGGPVQPGELADGSYEGEYGDFPNSARIRVRIEDGRIVEVILLEHGASWIGDDAEGLVELRIVEQQSTNVDVVSGATRSSHVIMNATEMALRKARKR
jgi:uncharacterized protein with FMN-binding domain